MAEPVVDPYADDPSPLRRWIEVEALPVIEEQLRSMTYVGTLDVENQLVDYIRDNLNDLLANRQKAGKVYDIWMLMKADLKSRLAIIETLKPFSSNAKE